MSSLGISKPGGAASIVVGNQTAASGEIVLQRAVTQSDYGSEPGLVQAGTGMTAGNTGLDACGTRTSPTAYTEFKTWGVANAYFCYWFGAIGVGAQHDYAVCHFNSTYDKSWYTVQDGGMLQQAWIGFNGGSPASGGELNNVPGNANSSTAIATYRNFRWFASDYCGSPTTFSTQYTYTNYTPRVSWSTTTPVNGEWYDSH